MNQGKPIILSDEQRMELERRVRSQALDARSVRRARIVLLAANGVGNHEIARRLAISRGQVITWRDRFASGGMPAIGSDRPGRGRKPTIDAAEIVRMTTQEKPEGATHWSTRKLAAKLGISDSSVLKVWRAHGLKPHLVKTFQNPQASLAAVDAENRPKIASTATVEPAAPAATEKSPWPATLPEQMALLARLLAAAPKSEPQLAARITGKGPWKKTPARPPANPRRARPGAAGWRSVADGLTG